MKSNISERTKRLALSAVFCALAFLVTLIPAPKVQGFLSFDIKDAVIATVSLLLGPAVAASLSVAVPFLEFITSGATGPIGLLMDVISTASFSVTASLVYKYRKTLGGAVLSLSAAALLQVAMMLLANVLLTPIYMEVPRTVVLSMLVPTLLPFNLVKSVFNASLVMLLYKPLSEALRRAGFLRSSGGERSAYRFGGKSLVVFSVSLLAVIGMALLLFLALGASWGGGAA
jgi:riboflavin transporter FmnP